MTRNWQLFGEIFGHIQSEDLTAFIDRADDKEQQRIYRHIELLLDADYIRGIELRVNQSRVTGIGIYDARITLKGYDFADIVQDKKLLNKTINLIEQAGLLVTTESLKALAPKALAALAALI